MASFWQQFATASESLYLWIHLRVPRDLRRDLDPEDVFQEVSVRACTQHHTMTKSAESFRAWLMGIARNVMRESFRDLGRQTQRCARRHLDTVGWSQLRDQATSVTRRVCREDSVRHMLEVMDALSEPERRLLLYHGFEGLTLLETSALLGIGSEACKKRWQRLSAKLQLVVERVT